MRKTRRIVALWLLASLTILGACSEVNVPAEEPEVEFQPCRGSDVPAQDLPKGTTRTWLDITVGKSTEQDVIAKFGEPDSSHLWPEDQPQACLYVYRDDNNAFRVWLAGNVVIGIEFSQLYPRHPAFKMAEIPQTFEQAKTLYGRADLVGYSYLGYGFRSLVWTTRGIQAEISIHAEGVPIRGILYFAPTSESEFDNSLWSGLVLDKNPTHYPTSCLRDNAPKDPFDWD